MIHEQRTRRDEDRAEINVRVVVYLENGEPEITEVSAGSPGSATTKITRLVARKVAELETEIPERAVREVVENLIHADYRGVVISVLDGGKTVRVSDRGPGIASKSQAMEFGFSGASSEALGSIRGVGAGLGIARSEVGKAGGRLSIEDNLGGGSVVTLSVASGAEVEAAQSPAPKPDEAQSPSATPQRKYPGGVPRINISERQQNVLVTVLECGEVGPSTIADRLEISVSTAYRDLSVLEEHGLVAGDETGKRVISPLGRDYVEAIISTWVK
jgi:anti-sigma regulatory factor (Ser/Thr protein kinase)/ribosomal protein S25